MGEIKSTLDLVMERTRHLTLSEEEKADQQRTEFLGLMEGLVQKVVSGALSADGARDELASLQDRLGQTDSALVLEAVLGKLDPEAGDVTPRLELAHRLVGVNTDGLKSVLDRYETEKESAAASVRAALEKELVSNRRIGGTAVAVNLAASPAWTAEAERLRRKYVEALAEEKKQLLA